MDPAGLRIANPTAGSLSKTSEGLPNSQGYAFCHMSALPTAKSRRRGPRVCGRNNGGTRQGFSAALKALLFIEAHNVSDDVVFRFGLNEVRHGTMRGLVPGVGATAEKLGASELGD
jgi:hypothetical protein